MSKIPKLLTAEEIKQRIDKFNSNVPYDYSIFDDVPPEQHYAVLYPHVMKNFNIDISTDKI